MSWWIQIWSWYILSFVRSDGDKKVLNLLKAKENVNVPLDCPAAKKPQQIIAAQPKHSNKPKVHTNTAFPQTGSKQSEKKQTISPGKKDFTRFHITKEIMSHKEENHLLGGLINFQLFPTCQNTKEKTFQERKIFFIHPPKKTFSWGKFSLSLYHRFKNIKEPRKIILATKNILTSFPIRENVKK